MTLDGYDVILAGGWSLGEIVESITLDEALAEIAMRATIELAVTPDFPGIEPGQALQVTGPSGAVFDGVVWEPSSTTRGLKRLSVTAYDRTIYLAKSEDEYLLPAGQTASQRLARYASDWELALGSVADTKVPLARAVYRAQPIYSMIRSDLAETARKGGGLFRVRMTGLSLDLVPLGSNAAVPALVIGQNVERIAQRRTLEGAVTRAKVLGEAADDSLSPVLAVASGDTAKFGTLQRVIHDSQITTAGEAKAAATAALAGVHETISVTVVGLQGVRAGDKVTLDGLGHLVTQAKRIIGPGPIETSLELADFNYVRRTYYA